MNSFLTGFSYGVGIGVILCIIFHIIHSVRHIADDE